MRSFILIAILLISLKANALADIIVIANTDSNIKSLTRHQIIDIYMERTRSLADKSHLKPYDYPVNAEIREKFYTGDRKIYFHN